MLAASLPASWDTVRLEPSDMPAAANRNGIGDFLDRCLSPREAPPQSAIVHSIADINAGICCSKNLENEAIRGGSAWYGG